MIIITINIMKKRGYRTTKKLKTMNYNMRKLVASVAMSLMHSLSLAS